MTNAINNVVQLNAPSGAGLHIRQINILNRQDSESLRQSGSPVFNRNTIIKLGNMIIMGNLIHVDIINGSIVISIEEGGELNITDRDIPGTKIPNDCRGNKDNYPPDDDEGPASGGVVMLGLGEFVNNLYVIDVAS